jgi:hypothetical protein
MVAITVVAGHALLELDMGQVGDQLRENSSTNIHPPLFRRRWNAFLVRFPTVFNSNRFFEEGCLYH